MMKLKIFLFMIALLTMACSTPKQSLTKNDLQVDMIFPDNADHIELQKNQIFFAPVPINTPLPSFPSDYSATDVRTVICSEIVVSEEGAVTSDQQISDASGCEGVSSEKSQRLYPLVHQAVHQWKFFGAATCEYKVDERECDETDARILPMAVKLAYKFTFTINGGRHSVLRDEM